MMRAGPQATIQYPAAPNVPTAVGEVKFLRISIKNPNQPLELKVDESYVLKINQESTLQAETLWGALHGLTTFAQFCQWNGSTHIFQGMPASIQDQPKFPWRGMLLDTSRHFLAIPTIKRTIDLLEMNKMNVFHWHLTDAESFGVVTPSIPEMAQKGAWEPQAVYTPAQIADIISYANQRGVRIVPEIDTPGHTYSWGKAYPEIILECARLITKKGYPGVNNVPFDITNNKTFHVVDSVMGDISKMFTDPFIHLGGDEISSGCVDEFPRVKEWMKAEGMSTKDYTELIAYYERRLIQIVQSKGKRMIFWQELFQMFANSSHNPLPKDTIMHVWINGGSPAVVREMVLAGYQTLISAGWYLDQQLPARGGPSLTHYLWLDTWQDFYANDMLQGVTDLSPEQQALVLGGEIAQWAEQVDDHSLFTRGWPRAAAGAERLWSKQVEDTSTALHRLMAHRCRLYQRGFEVSPLRPDYCQRQS